nr:unnamed protein product [Spirometra erinaceieuropaei]
MAGVGTPGLRSVQECRQDDNLVHLQFGVQLKAVAILHRGLKLAESPAGFGEVTGNFIVDVCAECVGFLVASAYLPSPLLDLKSQLVEPIHDLAFPQQQITSPSSWSPPRPSTRKVQLNPSSRPIVAAI